MPTLVEQISFVEKKIKWIKSYDYPAVERALYLTKLDWLQHERERLLNELASKYMCVHPYTNK